MSGIHVVYLVLALIFATFITYMFVYSFRTKNRRRADSNGRPTVGAVENMAAPTIEKERSGNTGNIS
jgi:hypothetical protein